MFVYQRIVIVAASLLMLGSAPAFAADAVVDPSVAQTISLFKEGKLQEAVELQEKLCREEAKSSQPHALLSYLYWQMGNAPDAIVEGQKAVRYAPEDESALINLAHMFQAMESYPDAIPLYQRAQKVGPKNWVPGVCLSRCYAKSNQPDKALQVLKEMSAQNEKSFDWNFQLGNAYLLLDKPSAAIPHFNTASTQAATPKERSLCSNQLLLALLRDNQTDQAKQLAPTVFEQYPPTNSEVYVRAAATLLNEDSRESGKKLLQSAAKNLADIQDSDGFFRLGKVFEHRGWLDVAEDAFNQAIELNPGEGKYHEALAGALWREGKPAESEKALAEVQNYNHGLPIAPYLVSGKHAASHNLSVIRFKINGLTCGCQVSKIGNALDEQKAVVFENVVALKPYSGTVIVDPSETPVKDIFAKCSHTVFGATELKEPITFDIQSEETVKSLDEIIRITQAARYGDVLQFPKAFDVLPPVLPVSVSQSPSGLAGL
jgi:pentatricopeptide repeat protein